MALTETRQIQWRNGTALEWTTANPTLLVGEVGYETDTGFKKIGNGVTAWNSLGYTSDSFKQYLITLSQSGTSAPVATIIRNTLGSVPVWARENVGIYSLTLADAFVTDKLSITSQLLGGQFGEIFTFSEGDSTYPDELIFYQQKSGGNADVFTNVQLDIKVFP